MDLDFWDYFVLKRKSHLTAGLDMTESDIEVILEVEKPCPNPNYYCNKASNGST